MVLKRCGKWTGLKIMIEWDWEIKEKQSLGQSERLGWSRGVINMTRCDFDINLKKDLGRGPLCLKHRFEVPK